MDKESKRTPIGESLNLPSAALSPQDEPSIDEAEACIRADYRAGIISKHQFQKEMLIMERARHRSLAALTEGHDNG